MARALRLSLTLLLLAFAWVARAGTLTIKSPVANAYLGASNQLRFLITGAVREVSLRAEVRGAAGTSSFTETFTPNVDGKIDDALTLNFNSATPAGDYSLVVTATESGATYPTQTIPIKIDVVAPRFLEQTPNNGQFVRGVVRIRLNIQEPNLRNWTVLVDGQAIPNNTGTTNAVAVDWDASTLDNDGGRRISISVSDLAGNSASRNIDVTVDRGRPVATIAYPRSDSRLQPGVAIPVLVDVADLSAQSVTSTGVDVLLQTLSGEYLGRVALVSYRSSGATTSRWTGRIRFRPGFLPSRFKIVVSVVDRAGNRGVPQEVVLNAP